MQAFRYIFTVEQNRVVIELPPYYNNKSVEVIILPADRNKTLDRHQSEFPNKEEQMKELLSIGVWNEDDLQPLTETEKLINQWKIDRF